MNHEVHEGRELKKEILSPFLFVYFVPFVVMDFFPRLPWGNKHE